MTDNPATLSPIDLKAELERIRAEKKPTQRGVIICGSFMGKMLQLGWKAEDLDALEILFWSVRDRNGRVIGENIYRTSK